MERYFALTHRTARRPAAGAQAKAMKWMDASAAGLPAGAKMAVV